MTRKGIYLAIGGLGLIVLSLVAASSVLATHDGVAYYLVQRVNDGRTTSVFNPTKKEMFALAVNYDENESFDNCVGMVLSANDVDTFNSGPDEGFTQIIAAPTSGGYSFSKQHSIGVLARNGKRNFFLVNPVLFSFEDSSVQDCACCELDNFGLSSSLLKAFGISCSNVSCE